MGGGHRCRQETHEDREPFDVTARIGIVGVGGVVRNRLELAGEVFFPLGLEQLVGDTLLDVVRLAREQKQRLVLRLPAETRDRAVIAVVIGLAGDRATGDVEIRPAFDPQRALLARVGSLVCEYRAVRDLLDQPRPEDRGGDPKDHVLIRELRREVRLREAATIRTRPAGDGEQSVDTAIGGSIRGIRVRHESRLAYRPVRRDERGNEVGSAVLAGERHLRIHKRARSADCRLRMTPGATVQVHPRSEPVGNGVHFIERVQAVDEKRGLRAA